MTHPPKEGSVLGIDVGFSKTRKTTCFCLLTWDKSSVARRFQIVGTDPEERKNALRKVAGPIHIEGVAIDGPLTRGLRLVQHYRSAEALLSRGAFQQRGKPGQTSSPIGQQLHQHATSLARLTLKAVQVSEATHFQPIHEKRVVEAFPNAFLAALIPEKDLPTLRRDAVDRYWETAAVQSDLLGKLLNLLLPGRELQFNLKDCTNHEHRAGVICALTALTVVEGLHVGVGDPIDGDIILPPLNSWGAASNGSASWVERELRLNLPKVRASRRSHLNHQQVRLIVDTGQWVPST